MPPDVEWAPTEAQKELIELDGRGFVEASPGSGKTRAIVARYQRLTALERRRGVGLLSFTNAAVDEVVARCHDPQVLEPPNFVGTFDAFINRFVTGPYLSNRFGRYPRFVDSWASIPGARFRIAGMSHGLFFELNHFDWDENGNYVFHANRAGRFGAALQQVYAASAETINARAADTRRMFIGERQIVSASSSRYIALRLLSDEAPRAMMTGLIAGRFAELIVDEAQDCGAEELELLIAAREAGVEVVAVADLDQAIFEFRRAEPDRVREFAGLHGMGTPLDGNFRSSPAICAVGDALRSSDRTDVAVGPHRETKTPVHVVVFGHPNEVPPAVNELLEQSGIAPEECRVLAHRTSDAVRCAGSTFSASESGRKVVRVAAAHLTLMRDEDPSRRGRAMEQVERIVLQMAESTDPDLHATDSLADQLGVSRRWTRNAATRVLYGADPHMGREAYTAEVRRIIGALDWPLQVTLPNLGQRLATPPEDAWHGLAFDPPQGLPWGTIHSAKGREFEAVVLVVPQRLVPDDDGRTSLDLWEAGHDGESRRVLYVGATRARQLLILAVHSDHEERIRSLLP